MIFTPRSPRAQSQLKAIGPDLYITWTTARMAFPPPGRLVSGQPVFFHERSQKKAFEDIYFLCDPLWLHKFLKRPN
jgi:hypothetical protein